ncbi:TRAP transporter substrate-binding protein [Synergistes jonesii]|uniref:TRAP transporter substrate-binding protein n=1 Tax=Synergistes jonesii TaxID=2754 RepID=UPI00242F26AC|nr:TRAP transporter substrate-binding protein [Synergistes jonesii]
MNKKIIIALLIILLAAGAYIFLKNGGKGGNSAAEKVTIKFASVSATKHPVVVALNDVFKKEVEEKSNGNISVQIFDNGSLGEESAMMEQTQLGTVQMASISEVISAIEPKINVLNLPYIFENNEQVDAVIDSELKDEILSDLQKHKLIGLQIFENGFRVVTNSKRPINRLADLNGLKIRTPKSDAQINIFNAFSANVTPLNFNELYGALQQKVVDGQENGYNTIVTQSFYEVQPYLAETNHMWGSFVIIANLDWWNKLTDENRQIIQSALDGASKYVREISREEAAKNKKICEEHNVQITTPDLAEFVKSVEPVYEKFYREYPDYKPLVEKLLEKKNH